MQAGSQSTHLDLSQTYGSFSFAAGAGESGGAAWGAAGATIFFGGSEVVVGGSAGIAGACCIGLGATSGLFLSMNAGCLTLFFASAKRTGTTRFSCLIKPHNGSKPEISEAMTSGFVAISSA